MSAAAVLPVAVIFVAGCSAGGSAQASTTPAPAATSAVPLATTDLASPAASSSALVLKLFITDTKNGPTWSTNEISAPADEAFQIALKIVDEDTHNVWIVTPSQLETERAAIVDQSGTALFQGDSSRHGTTTYDIPPLAAGTYYYVCTYHLASMKGTLTVP
jgi:plastocyanin